MLIFKKLTQNHFFFTFFISKYYSVETQVFQQSQNYFYRGINIISKNA